MAGIDMSLDDLIGKSSSGAVRRGGRRDNSRNNNSGGGRDNSRNNSRAATSVVRGGRAPGGRAPGGGRAKEARGRSAPYSRGGRDNNRGGGSVDDALSGGSVADVAASENPTMKVKADSAPKTVAGAISHCMRESATGQPPSVMATGPHAINQAMKAVAIARKYLLDEDAPTDLLCTPRFEQDIREGSQVCFELKKSKVINRQATEDDLACKEKTDPFKLAGAMAQRLRGGEQVAVTTKGPVPVLIAVKAIALAQTYLEEEDITIEFAVGIVDLENPDIRSEEVTSTYLHFALFGRQ